MTSRQGIALTIALAAGSLMACEALPTPTVTLDAMTVTPTATIIAQTVTPTPWPTWTPQATYTPPPTYTPAPTCAPPLRGDVILYAFQDENDDEEWQIGEEPGVQSEVVLLYDGEPRTGYVMTTTARGVDVEQVMPGGYTVLLRTYEPQECIVPYHDNPGFLIVNWGRPAVLRLRFWTWPGCTPTPGPTRTATATIQPTVTAGRTATATVGPHQCANYWVNCVPLAQACPAGKVLDPQGACQTGKMCCVPVTPTRTVTQ